MTRRRCAPVLTLLMAIPAVAASQVSVQAGVLVGRGEHRVVDDSVLVASSGTLVGGAVTLTLRERYQVRGEALSGRLTTAAGGLEDHDIAEARLLGGMKVRPWLVLETGFSVRNYSSPLGRQHWSAWRVGAEARVPLGFETVTAVLRGYWMPLVSVAGLARPNVALATDVGVDWRGRRLGIGALYTFERYDFPATNAAQRLEELSTIRVRAELWWSLARRVGAQDTHPGRDRP